MTQNPTLKRALTVWLVRQRVGKLESTRHYHREIIHAIRRLWRDRLCRPLSEIVEDDVTVFAMRAGHYSASRWNGMLTVLHNTIPAARTLKRRALKANRPPPPSQQEFSRLLAECDRLKRSQCGLVIDFLAHTGLRISAARAVRWVDVHEDRIEYRAKGGRRCSVPIVNGLRDVLDRLRALDDGSGYVLPRPAIRTGLTKACAAAGVRRLTPHDFRHLFTTRCLENGVDVGTVARWRGDSDGGAMLLKRYFHLQDEHSLRMAALVRI